MKKWLLMIILCLSVTGCDWFKSESPDGADDAAPEVDAGGDADAGDDADANDDSSADSDADNDAS